MSDRHDSSAYQKRISRFLSRRRSTSDDLTFLRDCCDNLESKLERIEVVVPIVDRRLSEVEIEKKEIQKELHAFKIWILCIIGSISLLVLGAIWTLYSRLDTKIDSRYDKIVQKYENIEGKIVDKNMLKSTAN